MKGIPLEESLDAIAQLEKIDPTEDLNKVTFFMTMTSRLYQSRAVGQGT